MLLLFIFLFIFRPIYIITENKMNILGLTGQHKFARKSGRKFILKFSPQADFNFVQPWIGVSLYALSEENQHIKS